jgi:hypothetical protein
MSNDTGGRRKYAEPGVMRFSNSILKILLYILGIQDLL